MPNVRRLGFAAYAIGLLFLNLSTAIVQVSAAAAAEHWTVGVGKAAGKPIFVRINMSLTAGDPKFPYRAVYAITFLHPTKDGRPPKSEMQKVDTIEEQLNGLIVKEQAGKFAAVQTHGGMRKYLFYVTSEQIARRAQAALNVPSPYNVELSTANDPTWSVYGKILSEQQRTKGK